jgi:hypothetical protein
MKFYYQSRDGKTRRELDADEVREYLSELQIEDALDAKYADPDEEVSYMARGGFIVLDF